VIRLALSALLALAVLAGCEREERAPAATPAAPAASAPVPVPAPTLEYVGTGRCAGCHAAEAERWRGSHHALAMQIARPDTILGRPDVVVREGGDETRLFERDARFIVRAEGPRGATGDYEALYTFGVDPLQQLLLPLDRGRLQATTVAWDARPRADGGQRWFALHGDERLVPDDVLHWTGPAQRWNSMCADCHATNVRKRYDLAADSYATSWSELGVNCEACHGPGSRHAEWAEKAERGEAANAADRALPVALASDGATWILDPGARIARRSAPRSSHAEIDACAGCHARRSAIAAPPAPGAPFLDTHRPALLDADLYTADGQIHDEVYEWGSFLQSRMYAAGVTCSDCHDPHSGRLRAEGNATCTQCHRADVFDVPAHHRHAAASAASRCVACHMPTRAYMVVDLRRDHSIRVPRPDLTVKLGTPNACNACHGDRSPQWAAQAVAKWYGPGQRQEPHFGEVLSAARSGAPDADRALATLARDAKQPAIARATALLELAPRAGESTFAALEESARDADPLLRLGVAEGAAGIAPERRLALLAPLLRDPLRAVRIAAARALVATPDAGWTPSDRAAHAEALAEWRAAEEVNADRPESHVDLGALHAEQGDLDAAKAEYETALRIGPWFVPAYLNYADLLRAQHRDDLGEPLLRRAIEIAPKSADAQHALGLLLVRTQRLEPALDALRRATELDPASERYAYVYGVALHSSGDTRRAIDFLSGFAARRPGDRSVTALLAELRAGDAPH
jgi:predicted CXXCH cytochrome family protein